MTDTEMRGQAPMKDAALKAHVVQFRLLMATWTTHFKSLDYVKETTMDMLDKRALKAFAELTMNNPDARESIGSEDKIWIDMLEIFHVASPSLEHRSYGPIDSIAPSYDGPSSNVIVANSTSLVKDLQRLDNLLAVARNLLTAGERVQNLAAQIGFDREVCAVINLCIKITARGYDGDGTTVDEDKWQGVINGFKRLLITSLQFLSNLVTMNERLKLMLWVELFDSNSEPLHPGGADHSQSAASQQQHEPPHDKIKSPPAVSLGAEGWIRTAIDEFRKQHDVHPDARPLPNNHRKTAKLGKGIWSPYFFYATVEREHIRASLKQELGTEPQADDILREIKQRWEGMTAEQRAYWRGLSEEKAHEYWEKADQQSAQDNQKRLEDAQDVRIDRQPSTVAPEAIEAPKKVVEEIPQDRVADTVATMETAADGQRKLHEGKLQLLNRLHTHGPPLSRSRQQSQVSPASPVDSPVSPVDPNEPTVDHEKIEEEDDLDEEGEDDESSEDEDYAIPGEDGRGLLTDVPLILGPNEIEVLPMVIMSGIVAPPDAPKAPLSQVSKDDSDLVNMYTIRCHLLLAQENGRNLLRELLIFVAAWDLREEELYFKFMVKIMEAILINGLMPFAYGAFKESKDIISPAQAVIMKLLTKIFHSRHGFVDAHNHTSDSSSNGGETAETQQKALLSKVTPLSPPIRYDIQIVHCLFSEFRQTIIPQICALIFLQGQIRVGHAGLDDFPLNLWDMERMYEGVYQYLEFFAILTDHEEWKDLMAEWEVVSELLTLLNELEISIPKGKSLPSTAPPPPPPPPPPSQQIAPTPGKRASPKSGNGPVPVSVERPYDVASPTNVMDPMSTPSTQPAASASTPNAPPTQWPQPQAAVNGSASSPAPPATVPTPSPIHDEPADFEWRNLKKLCILVLSSLVWKNPTLQNQVRRFGGIATILACCAPDEHNPFIREHAIMCLRFLLESNTDNLKLIRHLAAVHGATTPGAPFPPAPHKNHKYWGRKPMHLDVHKDDWLWTEVAKADDTIERSERSELHVRMREEESVQRARAALPGPGRTPEFAVPDEVLDAEGYETYVDTRGQVGLRRKNPNREPTPGERVIDPNARLQIFQPSFNGKGDKQLERIAREGGGIAVGSPPHAIRSRTPPSASTFEPRLNLPEPGVVEAAGVREIEQAANTTTRRSVSTPQAHADANAPPQPARSARTSKNPTVHNDTATPHDDKGDTTLPPLTKSSYVNPETHIPAPPSLQHLTNADLTNPDVQSPGVDDFNAEMLLHALARKARARVGDDKAEELVAAVRNGGGPAAWRALVEGSESKEI
ncbi:MAG: hypothetical protein Q9162_003351 [Coniocarpon cinnabarinum]